MLSVDNGIVMKRIRILWIVLFLTAYFAGSSQVSFQPKQVEGILKGVVYRNEMTLRVNLLTNGYSFAYHKGRLKTYYKTTYYSVELGMLRDPREMSQNRNIPISFNKISRSFRFGKQNHHYQIRAGKGVKRLLTDKARRRGVAVGYNYEAGPTLAILRPYYLELIYNVESDGRPINVLRVEKYSESNASKFLDYSSVFGGTGNRMGWNELSLIPGLQGKMGLFFSLGAFDQYAKSLEIGIMADMYIKKIPVMVETTEVSAKPYFINFYATLELGKRYN